MKQIAEKLTNFSVYRNGSEYLGVADVTLPSLESMSDTVSGAGIAGEVDSPTIGHYGSMTVSLSWRTVDAKAIVLAAPEAHALDFRGSIQNYDPAAGKYSHSGVKVSVRSIPKKTDLGKFEPGATTDTSSELEVVYLKVTIDGKTMIEIDKYNYICIINGVDYLAKVREQLGQ